MFASTSPDSLASSASSGSNPYPLNSNLLGHHPLPLSATHPVTMSESDELGEISAMSPTDEKEDRITSPTTPTTQDQHNFHASNQQNTNGDKRVSYEDQPSGEMLFQSTVHSDTHHESNAPTHMEFQFTNPSAPSFTATTSMAEHMTRPDATPSQSISTFESSATNSTMSQPSTASHQHTQLNDTHTHAALSASSTPSSMSSVTLSTTSRGRKLTPTSRMNDIYSSATGTGVASSPSSSTGGLSPPSSSSSFSSNILSSMRVKVACGNCKVSKTKCDANRPCQRCVRTDRAHTCFDPPATGVNATTTTTTTPTPSSSTTTNNNTNTDFVPSSPNVDSSPLEDGYHPGLAHTTDPSAPNSSANTTTTNNSNSSRILHDDDLAPPLPATSEPSSSSSSTLPPLSSSSSMTAPHHTHRRSSHALPSPTPAQPTHSQVESYHHPQSSQHSQYHHHHHHHHHRSNSISLPVTSSPSPPIDSSSSSSSIPPNNLLPPFSNLPVMPSRSSSGLNSSPFPLLPPLPSSSSSSSSASPTVSGLVARQPPLSPRAQLWLTSFLHIFFETLQHWHKKLNDDKPLNLTNGGSSRLPSSTVASSSSPSPLSSSSSSGPSLPYPPPGSNLPADTMMRSGLLVRRSKFFADLIVTHINSMTPGSISQSESALPTPPPTDGRPSTSQSSKDLYHSLGVGVIALTLGSSMTLLPQSTWVNHSLAHILGYDEPSSIESLFSNLEGVSLIYPIPNLKVTIPALMDAVFNGLSNYVVHSEWMAKDGRRVTMLESVNLDYTPDGGGLSRTTSLLYPIPPSGEAFDNDRIDAIKRAALEGMKVIQQKQQHQLQLIKHQQHQQQLFLQAHHTKQMNLSSNMNHSNPSIFHANPSNSNANEVQRSQSKLALPLSSNLYSMPNSTSTQSHFPPPPPYPPLPHPPYVSLHSQPLHLPPFPLPQSSSSSPSPSTATPAPFQSSSSSSSPPSTLPLYPHNPSLNISLSTLPFSSPPSNLPMSASQSQSSPP